MRGPGPLALFVIAALALPAAASADPQLSGSLSRGEGDAVRATLQNTGDADIRYLRLPFGEDRTVSGATATAGGKEAVPAGGAPPGEAFFELPAGYFPPGGSLIVDLNVTPAFPDSTPIGARFSSDGVKDFEAQIAGIAPGEPPLAGDWAVDIQGPATSKLGEEIPFSLVVSNVGTESLPAVEVTVDVNGPGGSLVSDDKRFGERVADGSDTLVAIAQIPALAPGESTTVTFQANFDIKIFPGLGDLTLDATLKAADSNPVNDTDQQVTSISFSKGGPDSGVRCPRASGSASAAAGCSAPAGTVRSLAGSASRKAARVEVAIVRLSGGARAAAPGCAWVASRRVNFRKLPADGKRCNDAIWLAAKGTRDWRLGLRKGLPKGDYAVYSRARGPGDARETRFSARDGNRLTLRIR